MAAVEELVMRAGGIYAIHIAAAQIFIRHAFTKSLGRNARLPPELPL